MKTKVLEIRDEMTCIAALAIKMVADTPIEDKFLWRCGYPRGDSPPAVTLMKLSTQETTVDPYHWDNIHTMRTAHLWITKHFDEIEDGQVIDTRVILGEAESPADPEIWKAA